MTKEEEYRLAVQLAAHERLLAELLMLVRAQRGSSTRLNGFRARIAAEIEQDEDHPVEIDPNKKAIVERVLQIIDTALGELAADRKRMRERG